MATPGNRGAADSAVFRGIVAGFLWLIFSSRIPGFPALQVQTEIQKGFEVAIRNSGWLIIHSYGLHDKRYGETIHMSKKGTCHHDNRMVKSMKVKKENVTSKI